MPSKFVFAAGQEASESSEESKKVQDTQSDTEKSEDYQTLHFSFTRELFLANLLNNETIGHTSVLRC